MQFMSAFVTFMPTFLVFIIGFLLKKSKLLSSADATTLLKVVFYVGAPALIYSSVVGSSIDISVLQLFLFAPIVVGINFLLLLALQRLDFIESSKETFAAMAIGVMVMNTGFLIPFIESTLGAEGISRLILLDTGNAIITFTAVYAFAVLHGSGTSDRKYMASKIFLSPPFWTLFIALLVKVLQINTPLFIEETLSVMARVVSPAILLALGIKFVPKLAKPKLLAMGLFLRFVFGGLLGYLFVKLFGLGGFEAIIVLVASMAPIGFNSITFADLEGLDSEYAAIQVSAGLIVGLVLTPLLISFLSSIYL